MLPFIHGPFWVSTVIVTTDNLLTINHWLLIVKKPLTINADFGPFKSPDLKIGSNLEELAQVKYHF